MLIAGLAMFLAGTLLCGAAWSLPALIVGRVLQALGACAGIVLGRAIIRDVYEREAAARGLAIVMMTMTLVPGVSPAIGAYLAEWIDWRAIFALLGVLGAAVLALIAFRLPETNPTPAGLDLAGMARSYVDAGTLARICRLRAVRRVQQRILVHLLRQRPLRAVGFAARAGEHLRADDPAADGDLHGRQRLGGPPRACVSAACGWCWAAARSPLRRLSGMAAWWWFGGLSVWMLFVPIAFTSIGDGLSQPAAMASGLSIYPRLAGTASGLMGFLQMAVAALGTIAVAALPHDSALGLIAVVGGFIAVAFASGIVGVGLTARRQANPACKRPSGEGQCRRQFAASTGGFRHDRRNQ